MDRVRGKRVTSYFVFAILLFVMALAIYPFSFTDDRYEENRSVRLNHKEVETTETVDNDRDMNNSFTECSVFGIKNLIKEYYRAYPSEDRNEILRYIDTFGNMDEESREFAIANVEQYMDISCLYMNGPIDNSYLVVCYGYAKFYEMDTTVPVIGKFFVRMNASGNYYICNSDVSNEISAYNEIMFSNRQMQELVEMAGYELDTACEVDEKLRSFVADNEKYFKY